MASAENSPGQTCEREDIMYACDDTASKTECHEEIFCLSQIKEVKAINRQCAKEKKKTLTWKGEKQMRDGNRLLLPVKCQWSPGDALINLSAPKRAFTSSTEDTSNTGRE